MSAIDGDTANSYDSLAVMVLSGKFDSEAMKIYDKDGVEVPREEIQEIICSSNQLKGKPKMLIIQTYNFKGIISACCLNKLVNTLVQL